MTDRELLQRALEELLEAGGYTYTLIKNIQARLAQPEQEPLMYGEVEALYLKATNQALRPQDSRLAVAFARAIEAAHGIGEKK